MPGGPPDGGTASAPKQKPRPFRSLLSKRNIGIAGVALVGVAAVVIATRYHTGSERRRYEAMLAASLDRIVTAQEGFFYDSTRYVASLRALPTVTLPQGVHVTLYNPDRRSWWGVATHDRLPDHHCVVWVGTAPRSLPSEARAPENETKPLCFDDRQSVARQASRS